MTTATAPLYRAKPGFRTLGNEYRIYADRIELHCRFLLLGRTIVLRRGDIVAIDTFPPPVARTSLTALKLDLADLYEHVGIVRNKGFFRQLRFTPDNPRAFVARAKEWLQIGG